MSLILEALKKSEARRQLGEAPGLGTPFTVTRRRRSALPVILILIVAAGAFGWYYLGSGPAVPSGAKAGAASPESRNARTTGTVTSTKPVSPAATPAKPAALQRPAQAVRAMPPAPLEKNAGAPAADANAPRNQRAALIQPTVVASGEGAVKPELPETPQPAAASAKPAMATATPPPRATSVPQPAPPSPAPTPVSSPATAAPVAPPAATPPPAAAAGPPAAPPVPQYYELPYNVRKDLPALNVTMHVYAATPAQRFILIDGERKGEGDSLKDGLTVREIRNDGVIMEFRGQQFFYPRPGR